MRGRTRQRVPAQLERGGDVDRAVERALDQPARQGGPTDRLGGRAPQRSRLAQARAIGGRQRDHAGDEAGGHGRAAGDRAQGAQHAVRVDAGRVDGEDEYDRDHPQADGAAGRQGLERDVGIAEHGHVPAADQDGVAAVADQDVDSDHEEEQRQRQPQRGPDRPPGPAPHSRPARSPTIAATRTSGLE